MEKNKIKTTSDDGRVEAVEVSEAAQREEKMLAFWNEHDIFNKSLEKDAPNGDFVFYDGPPFATGLPHYGHILAGTIKDAIPRFWTMNGYRVRRKWGWDCHGLPLENLIEKKLGLATKRDIEDYGVKKFNEAARDAVMEYADDWRRIIPRMGRFADMEDDYKTMDSSYTESVWWVFSELNKKGLVYEGFKGMHLCPRCGTTLSNFEVNQGYKDIKDISVYVKLPLLDEEGNPTDTSLLVWTTTPWTLPGNMAAAVHKDGDYVKVKTEDDELNIILAKSRLQHLGIDESGVLEEMKGSELVGKIYKPPFDYFKNQDFENKQNAWKIYHADYVEMEGNGTGAVHLAPAYGEEDMELAKVENIPIVHHVDSTGHFMDFVTDFSGQLVKPKDNEESGVTHLDADIEVVKKLKEKDRLFKKENITHSYPHCWRCDTPLLNYATTSWFVDVPSIKDRLVAENDKVHWVPGHVGKNRFGKWLEGAREWAVSRQRYWGAPLPVWRNTETKEYKIFGSLKELQEFVPHSKNQYLVMRHAESQSNLTGEIDAIDEGDNPLTEKGIEQCHETVKMLKEKGVDIIIHSGMQRTRETAQLVAAGLGLTEEQVLVDERITELQTGKILEGKNWSDYQALYETPLEKYTKDIEGVENRLDVQKRTGEFLYEIDNTYKDKKILVIAHASSTFTLRVVAKGADIEESLRMKEELGYLTNAEVVDLDFIPMPHNDNYQLDYHRPYIDEIDLYEGETKLERVPDVFDCWFESGSMPYAETHYPFENLDVANPAEGIRFPANFIAESVDQTRGWFYSLMVLGVALFDKSPYQNVITNGLVLAEDGKKLSKKLQNYSAPLDLANQLGADSMRFYLLSSSIIRGEDLNFSDKEVAELQRKNIGRLHNVLAMYEQYADGVAAHNNSNHVLDRWLIARSNQLVAETTTGFRNYELDKATRPVTDFIDDLSVWYLRRSRDRLKGEDLADKQAALATLRYALRTLSLVIAPSMPFYAEYLWQQIKEDNDEESVHLAKWPEVSESDTVVIGEMNIVREFASLGLEARAKANVKVRQPLATLYTNIELAPEYASVVADELNVKNVVFKADMSERVQLDLEITPQLKAEGEVRELMRAIQDMRKKAGFSAEDLIVLEVFATESGEALLKEYEAQVVSVVGAEKITFAENEGQHLETGENTFTVSIQKIN